MKIDRRDFLKLTGIGSVVFVSGLSGMGGDARAAARKNEDFFFIQMSDTHWGFANPAINPDPKGTLVKAVQAVNRLPRQPDFIVFTGDLSHGSDDGQERRKRMGEVRDVIRKLKVRHLRFVAGENDAAADQGAAFREYFGPSYYVFDHKGVHFIVLDNVSDPRSQIGTAQLDWLKADLGRLDKGTRIIVLTHRPLFDLYPDWDWHTVDGAKALDLLMPFSDVTVFYGHIHQEHHHMTGHIAHHAAKGMMYPFPPAGSLPKKQQVPWNAAEPYKGLGYRRIETKDAKKSYDLVEFSITGGKP